MMCACVCVKKDGGRGGGDRILPPTDFADNMRESLATALEFRSGVKEEMAVLVSPWPSWSPHP